MASNNRGINWTILDNVTGDCAICREEFRGPISPFPCVHNFCFRCFTGWWECGNIRCPECNTEAEEENPNEATSSPLFVGPMEYEDPTFDFQNPLHVWQVYGDAPLDFDLIFGGDEDEFETEPESEPESEFELEIGEDEQRRIEEEWQHQQWLKYANRPNHYRHDADTRFYLRPSDVEGNDYGLRPRNRSERTVVPPQPAQSSTQTTDEATETEPMDAENSSTDENLSAFHRSLCTRSEREEGIHPGLIREGPHLYLRESTENIVSALNFITQNPVNTVRALPSSTVSIAPPSDFFSSAAFDYNISNLVDENDDIEVVFENVEVMITDEIITLE